ncbi:MAG: hypothetical protein WD335_03335 [Candidatus Paceibacterota bacterium]
MNTPDAQQAPELANQSDKANFPIVRTIVVGIFLIGAFVVPYFGFPFFVENLVGLEDAFTTGLILLAIGVVVSAIAIYVRRRWKNGYTRFFICLAALMTIGSFLLFYGHFFSLVGNDITATLFPQSGLAGALFIIPFFAMITAGGMSWLISWWLLPVYRYLSKSRVMHSLLAAVLAIMIWPLLGYLLSAPAIIQGGIERRAAEGEITSVTYDVSEHSDIFNVQFTGTASRLYHFNGGSSASRNNQRPGTSGLTVVPKSADVDGEFFIYDNSVTGETYVQFRDSSGEVLAESSNVCTYDFSAPRTFSPDNTKYASQLSIDGLCEDLFVYDATTREAKTFSNPGRMIRWLDNEHALLVNIYSKNMRVYDTEEQKIQPITVPHDRFNGGEYNPMTTSELGADVTEGKPWLAVANTIEDGEACEVLLLNPQEKRQIVLNGFPFDSGCDGVKWEEDFSSLLIHEESEEFRGLGREYRLEFLPSGDIFTSSAL